jgi:hypothetical protein
MWSKSGGATCTKYNPTVVFRILSSATGRSQSAGRAGSCSCRESSKNSRRNACRFRLAPFDVSLKATNEEHLSTMSANAPSLSASFRAADTATSAFTWGRYARIGLLTIGASVVANAVFFYLAQVAVQYDPAFLPLGNVSAPIIFTLFPAVVAAMLYAVCSSLCESTPRWSSRLSR